MTASASDALGLCEVGGNTEAPQRLVLAEQLDALEEPRRHLRTGDRDSDRLEGLARRELESFGESAERRLDLLRGKRLNALELVAGGGDDRRAAVQQRRVGLDVAEQEAGEVRELAEALDLLLHDRRGAADELFVPVVACVPQEAHQLVGVLARRERAQVDAVHPVELLVVERRRAR